MPKRKDIKSILVIGAGPIIIGQACEFDYSGSQACKSLKEEGYKVILINSNPATVMTDPDLADKTYIEPVTPEMIKKIILKEKPDALLPTIGGQTGLNAAVKVAEDGFLDDHGVQLIGADLEAINKAEDREAFKEAMAKIGLRTTKAGIARNLDEAKKITESIPFPVIIRAAFTLGGTGGSIAHNMDEFEHLVQKGIDLSMAGEIIIEESIAGWKEYELEVMRDKNDNVVIICSIENFDPIGVHTGDSITVAPQQTLSDKEYQELRNMSQAIIREIGVETGGSNIQFAVHPDTGDVRIIEMNPRVSRSSALASKATGFPIAKIAAKLAVGFTLDEIPNDITRSTPACFEPTIDYVVTKLPRFAFEKFRSSSPILGVQMKSVGETMAIGRTFKESLQKGIRGLEINKPGFDGEFYSYKKILKAFKDNKTIQSIRETIDELSLKKIRQNIEDSHYLRLYYIKDAFFAGMTVDEIFELSKIDRWYLHHLFELFEMEMQAWETDIKDWDSERLKYYKENGFSDEQLAYFLNKKESDIATFRKENNVIAGYKLVDTCGGEFEAKTPYYYGSYDEENEKGESSKEKVAIIGGGPNRIGQGIEFDYMCVHASMALQEMGYETIMINSNPETVSTDYDVSDYLYFEPVTYEDVMSIIDTMKPIGVIVQLGGQTPLNLAEKLTAAGVPILGTTAESIASAEDRDQFKVILENLGFKQPENDTVRGTEEALKVAERIAYPIVVRPSFVLGGRAMEIVYAESDLENYIEKAIEASPDQPILIDKYLENAVEIDVDLICDGKDSVICGIMEHIEPAGIHSGDSGCMLPTQNISEDLLKQIRKQSHEMALALNVRGLMNVQFAIKDSELYFLEVNPRGSRTVPFVSKATGVPWVKMAVQVMAGKNIKDFPWQNEVRPDYVCVKEAMLPFDKFPDEDTILGPEMKSTGEVMGISQDSGEAYYKAQLAIGSNLPRRGGVLVTVNTDSHEGVIDSVKDLHELGFTVYATEGTGVILGEKDIENQFVHKLGEGKPDIADFIAQGKIDIIFNTPVGRNAKIDDTYIRLLAKRYKIPIYTTVWGMNAVSKAIVHLHEQEAQVKAIQEYFTS